MARILLVDADPQYRSACAADLEREGHEVAYTSYGSDALRLVREYAPHAVIAELCLPGGEGIALIYRLLGTTPRPLLLLNSASSGHFDCLLSRAVDAELKKANDTCELRTKLAALLRERNADELVGTYHG